MLNILYPALFLSVGWFLNEPTSLLMMATLSSIVIILFFAEKKFTYKNKLIIVMALMIPFSLLLSALVNNQNLIMALQGNYQRNFGIISWLSLMLIFLYFSNNIEKKLGKYVNSLVVVTVLATCYGLLQIFNLDPLPWSELYRNSIQLTLGNPNYAGALYGILSLVPHLLFLKKSKNSETFAVTWIYTALIFWLSINTDSIQGPLLVIVSISIFYSLISFTDLESNKIRFLWRYIAAIYFILGFLFISVVFLKNNFKSYIFQAGSIGPRLDYWRIGFKTFLDHPFLGVGPDNLFQFSSVHKTANQIVRDGVETYVDKAHSVPLDILSNGGILTFIFWAAIQIYVARISFKLILEKTNSALRHETIFVISVWLIYSLQSLFSMDHLFLAAIGYGAAGIIVGLYKENSGKNSIELKVKHVRIIGSIIGITTLIFNFLALNSDASIKKLREGEALTEAGVISAVEKWPSPRPAEFFMYEAVSAKMPCSFIEKIADNILSEAPRNSTSYYYKSLCEESRSDFVKGLKMINEALKFDPINPEYIILSAKLELENGSKENALNLLKKMRFIYKGTKYEEISNQLLRNL